MFITILNIKMCNTYDVCFLHKTITYGRFVFEFCLPRLQSVETRHEKACVNLENNSIIFFLF